MLPILAQNTYHLFQKSEQFNVLRVAAQGAFRFTSDRGNRGNAYDNWRDLPHIGSLPSGMIGETDGTFMCCHSHYIIC
ncbi:hypothetical protein Y032_0022g560 [Ancylostoma ceylanicum]|uniref:Uncharacterized protein n=1 Tax=Ancylostoma ceylanicum TaxID=53326 RepID=A0A016UZS4_9BILA|nr:hypothetical protein Y032_0022g560 [Ancylostoma ceylanicum]